MDEQKMLKDKVGRIVRYARDVEGVQMSPIINFSLIKSDESKNEGSKEGSEKSSKEDSKESSS